MLIIGARGLGCPVLLYLATAGVGTIWIIDRDIVSAFNLNQVIFGKQHISMPKALVAASHLQQKDSDVNVIGINEFLNVQNAIPLLFSYDLVIDESYNFSTRYLVNDACVLLKKPLIARSIFHNEGQVSILNVGNNNKKAANYRDLFPKPPLINEVPNCDTTGVIGTLPGVIGTIMAMEVIKLIADFGKVLISRVLYFDLFSDSFFETSILPNPIVGALSPASLEDYDKTDYSPVCSSIEIINWEATIDLKLKDSENVLFIDVRDPHEQTKLNAFEVVGIPMDRLGKAAQRLQDAYSVLVFYQSGIRSQRAVFDLKQSFPIQRLLKLRAAFFPYILL